jgi:sec-independent protein translocase protein TatC
VDITEHLAELRTRIMHAAFYVLIGFIVVYNCYGLIFHLVAHPLTSGLAKIAAKSVNSHQLLPPGALVFRDFTAPFMLRIQLSMIGGLTVSVPFITLEVWKFIEPALTKRERKPFRLLAPFAVFLFLLGVSIGFAIMPACVEWFLGYMSDYPNAVLLQDPQSYIVFLAKLLLAFGLLFQLPVVLMALGKFGIVKSKHLTQYWRYATISIMVLAMLISPSNDLFSILFLSGSLLVLFFISIFLVKLVEPKDNL